MTIKIIPESHVDHGLSPEQLAWLLAAVDDRTAFFVETFMLPESLGTVACSLIGPAIGAAPVPESDVRYVVRGERKTASRVCKASPPKPRTRLVTLVAGPTAGHEGVVLYTAYGGPTAPREPGDPSLATWADVVESRAFWAEHALIAD